MDKPSGVLPPGLTDYSIESKAPKRSTSLDQEAFLELMVAQLENQDPLNPMESGDFLGQLAQFSTVNGITELQESFATLAGALQSSQALQASTIVGRQVLVPGDRIGLESAGASAVGAVSLPQATGALALQVLDAAGQPVRRIELGAAEAGNLRFTWDGLTDGGVPAPAGAYRLRAEALLDDASVAVPVLVSARVESVSLPAGQAPVLNLAGQGSVSMDQIEELL